MSASPIEGISTGESDAINMTYEVADLGVGDYWGRINFLQVGNNLPSAAVEVHLRINRPHVPSDFDYDEDVDQDDFGLFQRCLAGFAEPIEAVCRPADLDHDGDVDLDDYQVFRACMGGADAPPGC